MGHKYFKMENWINELKEIAKSNGIENLDLFNAEAFYYEYKEGLTPQEAFDQEMIEWSHSL